MHILSGIVVISFGLFLIGLAVLIIIRPSRAEEFLRGFASSAPAHYTEQGLRLMVGAALANFSGSMRYPELFNIFGWAIIVSTAALLLIPWRWHHSFAAIVMPPVFRRMKLFAVSALALGAFVLYGAVQPWGL